ncbi:hypothetical protein EYZ11_012555 [Aspergillus tanneri]|uniref:Uncharacterized protein n=1 Tax=Aspergillus tanneri TaxID=1220188 RepID=A0A4S3IZY8_9EURO|nr:uncharacterized protein ATNIH1004_010495 [Aspergillus tanneri]KAA8643721.1 hypothetical protein ATNIH1004_010495 [Aspergillus tanneri]THC87996.1 hypothetical protein EYZ11_012555 [Aspergillus tanneri]
MLRFLYNQFFVEPEPPSPSTSFVDQVVIVTGANVGLGLEAARSITRLGASKVILAVRNVVAGEAARKSIEESTGRRGTCEVWPLDLASYASVIAFGRRVDELSRLDVVLANAAVATDRFQIAEDHELSITVNVISTVLLGLLVLPKMRDTVKRFPGNGTTKPKPHLTVVVSETHAFATFPEWRQDRILAALDDEDNTSMWERYPTSKLMEVLAIRELVSRVRDDAVIINMVNPGLCHSQLTRNASWSMAVMKFFLARTTEVGSRTLVAGVAAGSESHGEYMSNGEVASQELSAFVRRDDGQTAQKKIWKELSEIFEAIQPGIMENL